MDTEGRVFSRGPGSAGLPDMRARDRSQAEGAAGKRHFRRTLTRFLLQQVVFWYILSSPLEILSFTGEKKCVGFEDNTGPGRRGMRGGGRPG